jgi:hypothetical protein
MFMQFQKYWNLWYEVHIIQFHVVLANNFQSSTTVHLLIQLIQLHVSANCKPSSGYKVDGLVS